MGTFYIDKEKILENYKIFKSLGPVYFPLKTNEDNEVFSVLNNVFDNEDKFAISRKSHLKKELNNYSLINPLYSLEELEFFYNEGVRDFVFDNFKTFKSFKEKHTDIICSARINISELYTGTKTPIGCTFKDAFKMIKENCSLSIYCPEEIRKEDYCKEALILAKTLSPCAVRIGGINKNFDKNLFSDFKIDTGIKVITEPGTAIVEDAVNYECDVFDVKTICNKNYIILDATIYNMFIDHILYKKNFEAYVENTKLSYKDNFQTPYILCGRSSDYKDVLGTVFLSSDIVDKIETTKKITFKNVGAYFKSLENSNFIF